MGGCFCFLPGMVDFELVEGRERGKVGGNQGVKVVISGRRGFLQEQH